MGVGPSFGVSTCVHSSQFDRIAELEAQLRKANRKPRLPNPDPSRFILGQLEKIGRFTIAEVTYPDCTNYEGKKILIFEDVSPSEIRALETLDPHFCDDDSHISPVARFEPSPSGLKYARLFCRSVS